MPRQSKVKPPAAARAPLTIQDDLPSEDDSADGDFKGDASEASASEEEEDPAAEGELSTVTPPRKKLKAALQPGAAPTVPPPPPPPAPAADAAAIDALWAAFNDPGTAPAPAPAPTAAAATSGGPSPQASVTLPGPSGGQGRPSKVKITRTYKFAGEPVTKEVEVDADSEEAREFWAASASTPAVPSASKPTAGAPGAGKPAPRKRRGGGLSALSASLSGKPTKLTTLEKSKMDWDAHVKAQGDEAELEKSRKAGYLDKKDFLDRVEERQDTRR